MDGSVLLTRRKSNYLEKRSQLLDRQYLQQQNFPRNVFVQKIPVIREKLDVTRAVSCTPFDEKHFSGTVLKF